MMTIEYDVTLELIQDWAIYLNWDAPDKKHFKRAFLRNTALLYFMYVLFMFIGNRFRMLDPVLLSIGIALLVWGTLTAVKSGKKAHRKNIRDLYMKGEVAKNLPHMILMLSGTQLIAQSPFSETRYPWASIEKKIIHKNCYYLFTSAVHALVIPFSAFRTTDEKQKFEAILSEKLSFSAEFQQ
jgi:YcxB-like protein